MSISAQVNTHFGHLVLKKIFGRFLLLYAITASYKINKSYTLQSKNGTTLDLAWVPLESI